MSNVPKIKRRCVFCGVGRVTNEHVFPEWIAILLKENLAIENWRSARPDTPPWVAPELHVKAKQVCKKCNETWMSQLEDEAIPVLSPLLLSEELPIPLSIDQQKTLAKWSYKTALMASLIDKDRIIRGSAYTAFYSRRLPQERSAILIAAHQGTPSLSLTLREGHIALSWKGTLLRQPKRDVRVITFSIYRVVFQVILYYGDVIPSQGFGDVAGTQIIWPPGAPISWPPQMSAFSMDGLHQFANRFDWRHEASL